MLVAGPSRPGSLASFLARLIASLTALMTYAKCRHDLEPHLTQKKVYHQAAEVHIPSSFRRCADLRVNATHILQVVNYGSPHPTTPYGNLTETSR